MYAWARLATFAGPAVALRRCPMTLYPAAAIIRNRRNPLPPGTPETGKRLHLLCSTTACASPATYPPYIPLPPRDGGPPSLGLRPAARGASTRRYTRHSTCQSTGRAGPWVEARMAGLHWPPLVYRKQPKCARGYTRRAQRLRKARARAEMLPRGCCLEGAAWRVLPGGCCLEGAASVLISCHGQCIDQLPWPVY